MSQCLNLFSSQEEEEQMDPEERQRLAREVMQSRILTQDEFKQLRLKQVSKQFGDAKTTSKKGKGQKREATETISELMEASK